MMNKKDIYCLHVREMKMKTKKKVKVKDLFKF